jgi:RNA polymerase sigma-70 factor (ECF subfamily)
MTRHRDEELRRVYRTHVQAVYAFLGYSVSADVAEDLTSTTFERVVRSWSTFDPARSSERTWILAIARNALTDHYRRDALRRGPSVDEHPALLDRRAANDDALDRLARVEGMREWLRDLDDRERLLVALRYGADLTTAEAAATTGLSVANVQQILSRCLRRLRAASEGVTDSDGRAAPRDPAARRPGPPPGPAG